MRLGWWTFLILIAPGVAGQVANEGDAREEDILALYAIESAPLFASSASADTLRWAALAAIADSSASTALSAWRDTTAFLVFAADLSAQASDNADQVAQRVSGASTLARWPSPWSDDALGAAWHDTVEASVMNVVADALAATDDRLSTREAILMLRGAESLLQWAGPQASILGIAERRAELEAALDVDMDRADALMRQSAHVGTYPYLLGSWQLAGTLTAGRQASEARDIYARHGETGQFATAQQAIERHAAVRDDLASTATTANLLLIGLAAVAWTLFQRRAQAWLADTRHASQANFLLGTSA